MANCNNHIGPFSLFLSFALSPSDPRDIGGPSSSVGASGRCPGLRVPETRLGVLPGAAVLRGPSPPPPHGCSMRSQARDQGLCVGVGLGARWRGSLSQTRAPVPADLVALYPSPVPLLGGGPDHLNVRGGEAPGGDAGGRPGGLCKMRRGVAHQLHGDRLPDTADGVPGSRGCRALSGRDPHPHPGAQSDRVTGRRGGEGRGGKVLDSQPIFHVTLPSNQDGPSLKGSARWVACPPSAPRIETGRPGHVAVPSSAE